jgi:hypothetical protein
VRKIAGVDGFDVDENDVVVTYFVHAATENYHLILLPKQQIC